MVFEGVTREPPRASREHRDARWTVGELLQKSEDDLLAITNFGQKSLDEVIEKLDERGLSLRNRD